MKKICLVALILAVQISTIVIVAVKKQTFHIDEIYTYVLSNSHEADKILNADGILGNWNNGDRLDPFVVVCEGETFDYSTVYRNNTTDAHPPVYYWFVHSVCSFFPGRFSKWFGLGLNILFAVIAGIFLFLISDQLIESIWLKYLPLILYSFSIFALQNALFIRMYQTMTMYAAVFVWLHCRMYQKGFSIRRVLLIGLLIYIGAMTHYYMIVLSFFGVVFFSLWLLSKKQIKSMFIYGITALLGIGAMLLSYPYAVSQITGTSTNNVGNEVMKSLFDFKLGVKQFVKTAYDIVRNIGFKPIISALFVGTVGLIFVFLIIRAIKKKQKATLEPEILWIVLTVICTFAAISFIGGDYVYRRYFYYLIPLMYLIAVTLFDRLTKESPILRVAAFVLLTLFSIVNISLIVPREAKRYESNYEKEQFIEQYHHDKLIVVLDQKRTSVPTGNFTVIKDFDQFYIDTKDNIENQEVFADCLKTEDEFVVFITTDPYWTDGLNPKEVIPELAGDEKIEFSKLKNGNLGKYYLIKRVHSES